MKTALVALAHAQVGVITMKTELIRSNVETHGLEWAVARQQKEFKQNPCGANSFDTFYFALFGKWPRR